MWWGARRHGSAVAQHEYAHSSASRPSSLYCAFCLLVYAWCSACGVGAHSIQVVALECKGTGPTHGACFVHAGHLALVRMSDAIHGGEPRTPVSGFVFCAAVVARGGHCARRSTVEASSSLCMCEAHTQGQIAGVQPTPTALLFQVIVLRPVNAARATHGSV